MINYHLIEDSVQVQGIDVILSTKFSSGTSLETVQVNCSGEIRRSQTEVLYMSLNASYDIGIKGFTNLGGVNVPDTFITGLQIKIKDFCDQVLSVSREGGNDEV